MSRVRNISQPTGYESLQPLQLWGGEEVWGVEEDEEEEGGRLLLEVPRHPAADLLQVIPHLAGLQSIAWPFLIAGGQYRRYSLHKTKFDLTRKCHFLPDETVPLIRNCIVSFVCLYFCCVM